MYVHIDNVSYVSVTVAYNYECTYLPFQIHVPICVSKLAQVLSKY